MDVGEVRDLFRVPGHVHTPKTLPIQHNTHIIGITKRRALQLILGAFFVQGLDRARELHRGSVACTVALDAGVIRIWLGHGLFVLRAVIRAVVLRLLENRQPTCARAVFLDGGVERPLADAVDRGPRQGVAESFARAFERDALDGVLVVGAVHCALVLPRGSVGRPGREG